MSTFQLNFVYEACLMDLVLLKFYGFSVDCNAIDKLDILNIHKDKCLLDYYVLADL